MKQAARNFVDMRGIVGFGLQNRNPGKEASGTSDLCLAKNATQRAARPDPSRLAQDDIELHPLPTVSVP
jgi:hypothetical protein